SLHARGLQAFHNLSIIRFLIRHVRQKVISEKERGIDDELKGKRIVQIGQLKSCEELKVIIEGEKESKREMLALSPLSSSCLASSSTPPNFLINCPIGTNGTSFLSIQD